MAGRGSPIISGLGSRGIASRVTAPSKPSALDGRKNIGMSVGSTKEVTMSEVLSGKSDVRSRMTSRRSTNSKASYSSRIQTSEVELRQEEELAELADEEEYLVDQEKDAKEAIDFLRKKIEALQDSIEKMPAASMTDRSEKLKVVVHIEDLQKALEERLTDERKLKREVDRKMRSIQRRRAIIEKTAKIEKAKIAEDVEQALSSDEENERNQNSSVIASTEEEKVDRIDEFLESAEVERQKQLELDKKEAESKAQKEAELKAQKEAQLEAERLEIQKKIVEQKLKVERKRVEAQKEADRLIAEEMQKQLDLEAQLKDLSAEAEVKDENVSVVEEQPKVIGDERLIEVFAKAIKGCSSQASVPDINSKFLARQSYAKDLPIFSGKADEWPIFHADFVRSTKDCGFSNGENMSRLRKCLKGDAAQYVQSLMVSPDNVDTVMKKLEIRFGQPELIIKAMIVKAKAIPPFKEDQLEQFILFGSAVQNVIATIKTLNRTSHLSNPQLLDELEVKLPRQYMMHWLNWIDMNESREKNLVNFAEWIDKQTTLACKACPPSINKEETQQSGKKKFPSYVREAKSEGTPSAAGLLVGEKQKADELSNHKEKPNWGDRPRCIFCDKHFDSTTCYRARTMPLEEKLLIVKENNCCILCLKPGHWAKNCKRFVNCVVCGEKHMSVMCPSLGKSEVSQEKVTSLNEEPEKVSDQVKTPHTLLTCYSRVLLETVMVPLKTKNGHKMVRAVFDSGSQVSLILKSVADELQLPSFDEENLRLEGVGQTEPRTYKKYGINLKHARGDEYTHIEVIDKDHISTNIVRPARGPWLKELKYHNIWISDIGDDCPKIELLIGNKYRRQLLTGKMVKLSNGLVAEETLLGWFVSGESSEPWSRPARDSSAAMTVTSMFVSESSVSQLWDLEVIGIKDPIDVKSKEEREAKAKHHFLETVSRTSEGRYSVSLPWISEEMKIPDNKKIAEARLESVTKKLIAQEKFEDYDKIFKDWCQEGIIEEVPEEDLNQDSHYIPHRAVFKPESRTTPIRPVFDASCKGKRTPSLNECLEKGPNLLELLVSIILKFREGRIGILADIRKAFQMIEVRPEDRNYLRFLWWKDVYKKEYKVYRHRRVVFGVNCSPFLLAAVLEHLLTNVKEEETNMAQKVLKSLYVDNLVTSVDSLEEAVAVKKWSTDTLASAKMELREWEAGTADESLIESDSELDFGRDTSTKPGNPITSVLGYKWDKIEDEMYIDLKLDLLPQEFTKRLILSWLQKIYDPIGFTCPVTLMPKMLIQELWKEKTSWDSIVTDECKEDFVQWCKQLDMLSQIKIPRNMTGGISSRENWQVHAFGDASKKAYAAVVFLRAEDAEKVSVQLLMAKSRVAPLKKTTINRLELMSCFIATTLTHTVKETLELEDVPVIYWSDSSTALAWIRRNDEWGTFVGNRVRTIVGLTKPEDWRHVPGTENPADLPSRGCSASHLVASRWWEGPAWLRRPKEEWPSEEVEVSEEEIAAERKKVKVLAAVVVKLPWYCKKRTYWGNVRTVAWFKRFFNFLDKNDQTQKRGPLSVEEITEAEDSLWKLVQKEVFPTKENTIDGIQVQRREDGLIRVRTKLGHREDTEEFKYPILLPFDHLIVHQLIWHVHMKNKHAGIQFLMGCLREKYWIIKCRRAIKGVVSKCFECRRHDARKPNVVPASLPEGRVNTSAPFKTIGVDLAGPLYTRGGDKAWIVLVTCASYRCVHLELVMSLSTDSFMDAFSRFTARRGRPDVIYSDNGTNFVGAENALQELDWDAIKKEHAVEKIRWYFNPPAAPWWGGFWERLIRSVKTLLRRTLGKRRLSYEKLETLIIEVEAVINGRPLTVVTEDPNDLRPLTPAMFLHETPYPNVTDRELLEASGFQKLLQGRKTLLDEIKMRFRKEYLALLVHRGKQPFIRKFEVGEAVLIGSDDKKRWEWPIGRVLELIPGKDGHVRVAKVLTNNGIFTRPIQWIFAMELSKNDEDRLEKVIATTRSGRKVKPVDRYGK